MCDYSLHGIPNRLAREGEVLVVHRFYTGSKGLTSPKYIQPTKRPSLMAMLKSFLAFPGQPKACAVCIPDGARLTLNGIAPRLQKAHGLSATETVTFRQLSAEAHAYRDAVEFRNGLRVRLQELEDSQRVEVLTLSSEKVGVQVELMTDVRDRSADEPFESAVDRFDRYACLPAD
jgi:hypothetical protein